MESHEISLHQLRVFEFVRDIGVWVTASDIQQATGVAARTARLHARNLVRLGLFEQATVYPGNRYRIAADAERRNRTYIDRLEQAREAFGAEDAL